MKKTQLIMAMIAGAVLAVFAQALVKPLMAQQLGQQAQPSYAREFSQISQQLSQLISGQGRIMSTLDRVWQDTRRRR